MSAHHEPTPTYLAPIAPAPSIHRLARAGLILSLIGLVADLPFFVLVVTTIMVRIDPTSLSQSFNATLTTLALVGVLAYLIGFLVDSLALVFAGISAAQAPVPNTTGRSTSASSSRARAGLILGLIAILFPFIAVVLIFASRFV
jgi:hypothetical protein